MLLTVGGLSVFLLQLLELCIDGENESESGGLLQ